MKRESYALKNHSHMGLVLKSGGHFMSPDCTVRDFSPSNPNGLKLSVKTKGFPWLNRIDE